MILAADLGSTKTVLALFDAVQVLNGRCVRGGYD
jgi:hypothetical protein